MSFYDLNRITLFKTGYGYTLYFLSTPPMTLHGLSFLKRFEGGKIKQRYSNKPLKVTQIFFHPSQETCETQDLSR